MTPDRRRWWVLPGQPIESIEEYVSLGGGESIANARRLSAEDIVSLVSLSGLRGRGGAGFPTGTKWRTVARGGGQHRFAVCNAAEGEPGTFKDRALIRANPYQVVEGLIIAAQAVEASEAYVVVKDSFATEADRLAEAINAMDSAGWLGDLRVQLVRGPEEYLLGEEKALLEVIEGNDPLPRWLPPYLHGLFATSPQLGWEAHESEPGHRGEHLANPTLVNNAETLAHAAWILANGPDAFLAEGTEASPGRILCTVTGDVRHARVVEVGMGTPLQDVLTRCGGPREGHIFKAVLPGVAASPLPGSSVDTPLTYEHMVAAGSALGAGGFIVYDDSACMVEVAAVVSRFLYVESCGQCLPCKLGTEQITAALERIRDGVGTADDIETIEQRLQVVADGNRCFLPVQEKNTISSLMELFPEDFAAHLTGGCSREPRDYPTPKLVDLRDGTGFYDALQERKRPDWTYG